MKIAFLFLTIEDIYYPNIWNNYFKNNWDNIEIFCHPKYPEKIKTEWLKNSILPKKHLVETKWGYLSNAYIELLLYACKHSKCDKFIFISESCLPIKSFNELYKMLMKDNINTSYISHQVDIKNMKTTYESILNDYAKNIINNKINKKDINKYILKLMKENIYPSTNNILNKHTGWFCLSRFHLKKLLKMPLTYMCDKIELGDEHFLSGLSNLHDNLIKEFKIIDTTWNIKLYKEYSKQIKNIYNIKEKLEKEDKNKNEIDKYNKLIIELRQKKLDSLAHPIKYSDINKELLLYIKNSKSFFFRKFSMPEKSNNIEKTITTLIK
jgi:hypothetical protein